MIYLDNAATTLQKPQAVRTHALYAMRHLSSPGRGGYPMAAKAEEMAFACREAAGKLFHLSPERVVFTSNATHGLNIAIKSVVRPGDQVLISGYEHNAVTRPLYAIPNLTCRIAAAPLFQPKAMLEAVQRELSAGVSAVVCTHVSNVFGYVLPMDEIAVLCREYHVPLIVDASQSAGVLPVDCDGWGAAYVAMPGHKALYGPQGTGLLLCGIGAEPQPLLEGGTGSLSKQKEMPDFLPDRLEAGTHNMPGIAGLLEGIRFVSHKTPKRIFHHEQRLIRQTVNGMFHLKGVRFFAAEHPENQAGVLSFQIPDMDCQDAAQWLAGRGIAVRAGFHCASLAHKTAGTWEEGTIRMSVSVFNTEQDVFYFLEQLRSLLWKQRKRAGNREN